MIATPGVRIVSPAHPAGTATICNETEGGMPGAKPRTKAGGLEIVAAHCPDNDDVRIFSISKRRLRVHNELEAEVTSNHASQ
jgi:hypothetical protein